MFFSLAFVSISKPWGTRLFCFGLLIGGSVLLGSCSKKVVGPPPVLAVLRFENLSGDPSLEWLARAASDVLTTSLSGAVEGTVISASALTRNESALGARPTGAPGISSQRSAAILAGAKHLITGYFERTPNGVRLAAEEEDTVTGKTLRSLSVAGPASLDTLARLSREFAPAARPYLTRNNDALRLYISALERPIAEAEAGLRQAVAADPAFGPPWIALEHMTGARGDRAEAARLIGDALTQKLDKLSTATLKLDKAQLAGDQAGQVAALTEIIEASPGDTPLLRQLAQTRSTAGQYAEASELWKKLTVSLPDDADVWNQLGYNRAWAGDYPGALAAMRGYARIRPQDPNSDDSTGDIHLMYRHYPEAAASYLASVAKAPSFQNGTSVYKAAWAKFLAGDKPAAEKLFGQYRALMEKQGAPNLGLIEGEWLYRTGREKQALTLVRQEVLKLDKVDSQSAFYEVLTVWDLLAKDREAALRDSKAAGPARSALGAIIQFAVLPSGSAAEWWARADRMIPGPALASLRNLALGYALILDGKRTEALPVWEQIMKTTPAGDFALRAVYQRLKGEKLPLDLVPAPGTLNPFGVIVDKL